MTTKSKWVVGTVDVGFFGKPYRVAIVQDDVVAYAARSGKVLKYRTREEAERVAYYFNADEEKRQMIDYFSSFMEFRS
jgi:hypothetical protein